MQRSELFGREDLLLQFKEGKVPPGIHPNVSKALAKLDWERCEREDRAAITSGVTLLSWDHPAYPGLLKQTPDPPPALYVRGSLEVLAIPCVALVGSRLCTIYGQNVAQMLGEDLAKAGMVVVSGLARGIDTSAHRGSLVVPERAVAVLGTGIDVIYPRENKDLADRIASSGGAVVSEFPPGSPPLPRNFPARNRVIAGLSWAVVVVEATEKSGALITARFALETGREVFAVPHNLTSRTGIGPNTLIQKGAKLIQQAGDVVEELPAHLRCMLKPRDYLANRGPSGGEDLTSPAQLLLGALAPDSGITVDALCETTGLSASAVLSALLELQMAGLCVELPGMRYALKRIAKESN
jgi:DNA processing protein